MPCRRRTFFLTSTVALSIALLAPGPAAQARVTFTAPAFGTLEGKRTGPDRFVTDGIGVSCDGAAYGGIPVGNSATLELEPEFAECTGEGLSGFPADFFQEDCDYLLHGVERMQGRQRWRADVDLTCRGEFYAVGWDFFETEKKYEEVRPVCSTRVPEQAGIGTAELRNLGGRSGIEIRWNLGNLDYLVVKPRVHGSSMFCGSMFDGMRKDAYYRGTTTVVAKDLAGHVVDLSLSG